MVHIDGNMSGQTGFKAKRRKAGIGHAKRTAGYFKAAETGEDFRGLPELFSHPKQLLEPLRRCGARLPFPREALDTLTLLLDFSDPADWQPGGLPLVFPGNAELAGCLGVTERSIRNHLAHLQAAGAIYIRRGPGNRRTPVRDGNGHIVEAYGVDLSPLAALAHRLAEDARALKARRGILKSYLRRIQASLEALRSNMGALQAMVGEPDLRREMKTRFAEAEDKMGIWLEEAEAHVREARRLWSHDPIAGPGEQQMAEARLQELTIYLSGLEGDGDALTAAILCLMDEEETGRVETSFRQDSTNDSYGSKNQYSASQESVVEHPSTPLETRFDPSLKPSDPLFTFKDGKPKESPNIRVRMSHILQVYPDFADILGAYLLIEDPKAASERDIADAARLLAMQMGVSDWCWRTGCARHGRLKAALAMIVSAAKPDHEIQKSRAALAAGLLLREPDDLHILKSFHALRKRRMT